MNERIKRVEGWRCGWILIGLSVTCDGSPGKPDTAYLMLLLWVRDGEDKVDCLLDVADNTAILVQNRHGKVVCARLPDVGQWVDVRGGQRDVGEVVGIVERRVGVGHGPGSEHQVEEGPRIDVDSHMDVLEAGGAVVNVADLMRMEEAKENLQHHYSVKIN